LDVWPELRKRWYEVIRTWSWLVARIGDVDTSIAGWGFESKNESVFDWSVGGVGEGGLVGKGEAKKAWVLEAVCGGDGIDDREATE
jgi:hypothetical protein